MRIYLIVNNINGKMYVGQTTQSLEARWKQHQLEPRCTAIHNAIKKYGPHSFDMFEIATAESISQLNELEEALISDLKTLSPNGYNLRSGGLNKKHSEISKAKMCEVQKVVYKSNWGNGRYPNTGTKFTLEQRLRQSKAHLGKKHTPEQIEKRRLKLMKPVLCITTNVAFQSIDHAALAHGLSHQHMARIAKNGKTTKSGLQFRLLGDVPCAS